MVKIDKRNLEAFEVKGRPAHKTTWSYVEATAKAAVYEVLGKDPGDRTAREASFIKRLSDLDPGGEQSKERLTEVLEGGNARDFLRWVFTRLFAWQGFGSTLVIERE